jgi:hypothetical protein
MKLSEMTYNQLLDEIGYCESKKEALQEKIYEMSGELKRRRNTSSVNPSYTMKEREK